MRKISLGFAFLSTILLNMSICYAGPTGCNVTIDGYGLCKQDINDYNGVSAPAVSNLGQGRIYFDNILNKFQCSENGNAYVNCVGGGGSGTGNVGIGTTNWISYYPSNGSTVVANSNIQLIGGNVGIGTASASKLLTIGSTGQATVDSSGNITTSGGYTQTGTTADLFTGNVNIGAGSNPGYPLFVSGNSSGTPYGQFEVANSTTGHPLIFEGVDSGGFPDYGSILLSGAGSVTMALRPEAGNSLTGYNPNNVSQFSYYLGFFGGGDVSEGSLELYEAGTKTLTLTANHGALFNSGNVGIGTAVASQPLTVAGKIYSTSGGIQFPDNTVQTTASTGGSGTVTSIATTSPITGGTITTTGNIGIGTSSPLIVSGGLLGVNTTGTWNGNAVTASNGINTFTTTGTSGAATYSAGVLNIPQYSGGGSSQWTTTNTNDVYLPSNGNVGIGTNLTTTSALTVMNGNVGIGTWIPLGKLVVIGGNIGIGTNVPGQTLDVNGAGRFLGTGNTFLNPTSGNVGIGTAFQSSGGVPQPLYVVGTIQGQNVIDTGITANTLVYANGSQQLASATVSTGLGLSTGTLTSNAVYSLSYQPGLLSAVNATIGVYGKVSKASTVDNIIGSATTFSCIANPTITMYECGTSTTCVSPTSIGTVTVTASGTAFTGTITSASITAGDFVGFSMTSGTCASIDISAAVQVHSN